MKAMRDELTEHVGGKPTIAQQILIEQACTLRLRIALMEVEQESDDPGRWTERRQVQFLAWTGALSRLIRDLGLEGARAKPPHGISDFEFDLEPHRGVTS